jgi:hypothetical protein
MLRRASVLAVVAALLAAAPTLATAQFKWVDETGRVTYSDLPPPPGTEVIRVGGPLPARSEASDLPAVLKQPAASYPVVLYTTSDCSACQQARAFLAQRGIPFTERTVRSAADAEAFRRLGFTETALPALTVGRERTLGFESGAWAGLLDAAGYPSRSVLPRGFQPAPPRALSAPAAPKAGSPVADSEATASAEAPVRGSGRTRPPIPAADTAAARDPDALRF